MKLNRIEAAVEKTLQETLPGWKIFRANVVNATQKDLPCVNRFFDQDRFVRDMGHMELRQVFLNIEAGFETPGDEAEQNLIDLREIIDHAIQKSQHIQLEVTRIRFMDVKFCHDMTGEVRTAVLVMRAQLDYQKPHVMPSAPPMPAVLIPVINGEAEPDVT